MPQSRRSLRLTDSYRARLLALSGRTERLARESWPTIERFDATDWPEQMARAVERAQVEGLRLTSAYVTAFIRSETGRGRPTAIDRTAYVGIARDGQPLTDLFQSPLIGVRAALKEGRSSGEALRLGLVRGMRSAAFEAIQTPRDALLDVIRTDERLSGHERSVAGTCAACMALSGTTDAEVHPGCQCLPQPIVRGVVDRFPLPSGAALFSALTKPEQEKAIGAEAAQLVRDGDADLKDFVAHSRQEERDDFITQKPVAELATT